MEPCFIQSFVYTGPGNSAYLIGFHKTKKGDIDGPASQREPAPACGINKWQMHKFEIVQDKLE
jgi:hypothetical protein